MLSEISKYNKRSENVWQGDCRVIGNTMKLHLYVFRGIGQSWRISENKVEVKNT